MRDFERPGRSEALGTNGMAATSHPWATDAALNILRSGGNAIDAAVAAAAVLAVVEPTQTGIGGDCFVMFKKPGEPVSALSGAGWTPARANVEAIRRQGLSAIDPGSADAVTVPGSIRTWHRLVKDHGSLEWARILQPAIHAAEHGYPVLERLARDWARQLVKLQRDPHTARVFLKNGAPFQLGEIHVQPALAKALRSIALEGADVFYEGWIAQDIVNKLESLGGLHDMSDFGEWRPEYVTPISTDYHEYRLWECPPSGQGIVALTMAAMLNHFDLTQFGPLSVERFHLFAEAARLAYAERDHFLCDSDDQAALVKHFLDPVNILDRVARIDPKSRLADIAPAYSPKHSDTVYLTVVDQSGIAVSFINSVFDDFGSGILAPDSGVLLHNRGCGFVVDPLHPNVIAGRKRPMHTIIPALLTKDDETVLSFGVTGAHFQPLGQIQVLTNIIDYGMTVQQALDHPRIFAHGDTLELESTIPQSVMEGLQALGHRPVRSVNPLGAGQAIWIDRERGIFRGGADPRRDGMALGY